MSHAGTGYTEKPTGTKVGPLPGEGSGSLPGGSSTWSAGREGRRKRDTGKGHSICRDPAAERGCSMPTEFYVKREKTFLSGKVRSNHTINLRNANIPSLLKVF